MANSKTILWKAGQSAKQSTSEVLPPLATAFFAQGEKLTPQAEPEALHQFRIQAKHFRDTLDLFRPCYDSRLDELIQSLRTIQRILGELNDLATTRDLLAGRDLDKSRQYLLSKLDARMVKKVRQFFSAWQQTFACKSGERRWVTYLATGKVEKRKRGILNRVCVHLEDSLYTLPHEQ